MNFDEDPEAAAFSRRAQDRAKSGFVPDLSRLTENAYFYKSFWRYPHTTDLYVGRIARNVIALLGERIRHGGRVLDAGCGSGYFTLELARAGYQVVGVDISSGAVDLARATLKDADLGDRGGSVRYIVADPMELSEDLGGEFDAVTSFGFLHHIPDVEGMVRALAFRLRPAGLIVVHEPQHHAFSPEDAFWVSVIRQLLSYTGKWYEDPHPLVQVEDLRELTEATHWEYVMERDPSEPDGQSPNDLSSGGEAILWALSEEFEAVELMPSAAFIYRTVGGLRGSDRDTRLIASFLAMVDEYAVREGYLRANYFYAHGVKKPAAVLEGRG